MRLREIGKAEEVLRASFRELNSNMNSWNREFFEGLRFDKCICVLVYSHHVFAATCSLGYLIKTTTPSSWDKKVASFLIASNKALALRSLNEQESHVIENLN